MRRSLPVVAVAPPAAALLAGARGLSAFQATPVAGDAAAALVVIERAETDTVVDLGDQGDSRGDTLAFANPVSDAVDRQQIGASQGSRTRVAPGRSWECAWTTILPEGQIGVQGPFLDAGDSVLAITGGTGADARGEMRLSARAGGAKYGFAFDRR